MHFPNTDTLHEPLVASREQTTSPSESARALLRAQDRQTTRCHQLCFDGDPVVWRSSNCDCCSQYFIKSMVLFEDRNVEALYLQHAKNEWRAKIVPPVVTMLACAMATFTLWPAYESPDFRGGIFIICGGVTVGLVTIAGLVFSIAQTCKPRIQYKLRAATLTVAVTTATAAFLCAATSTYVFFGPISAIGMLWVCHKALVISDVVAARVLVAIVPFNTVVLVAGVVAGVYELFWYNGLWPEQVTRTALQLGTSVLASSGVLLWLALRHESASRTLFYWSRVVDANVETLDAEANPFNQHRLLDWLSRDTAALEMVPLSNNTEQATRQFWELDGSLLTLDTQIAAGNGGVVWKATYRGKAVAAKQLFAHSCTRQEQLQELAMEVSVLAQLSHTNIVRFLGLCRHSAAPSSQHAVYLPLFIVQEYCFTNLRSMLSHTFPTMASATWPLEVRRVAAEIASAMKHLHTLKVLHRDLKPENVLLTDALTVRVADFGVSLQFFDSAHSAKATSGTPEYMPPEALCNIYNTSATCHDQPVDEMAGDIYAFGVVMCELVHSRSNVGVLDTLVENAVVNCKLGAIARLASSDDDIECAWAFPPFCDDAEQPVRQCAELARLCCAFNPRERPAFVDICLALDQSCDFAAPVASHPSQEKRVRAELSSRSRSVSDTGDSTSSSVIDKDTALRATPRLSAASIEVNVDFEKKQHRQVGVDRCAWWCWHRHELRFADSDTEHRFLAFLHSEEFFRYLRWPNVVLATLQLVFAVTMFATHQSEYAPYPSVCTVLFGTAACYSWVPTWRQWSMLVLTAVAVVAALVECATVWSNAYTFNDEVSNSSNWTLYCECNNASFVYAECVPYCFYDAGDVFFMTILLPLVQGLTAPVTMLVLGLPFYLYMWLLALSVISWMGIAAAAFALWWDVIAYSVPADFFLVVVPGVVLYPICAVTAIAGERLRRQMFLKLCSLRAQEDNLLKCATLRGYRDVLTANWRFLESSSTTNNQSKASHIVTTATI